jgi:hypothetical protein
MGLTVLAELGFGAIELMLGGDATVSGLVVRDMLIKGAFAFVLGWPLYIGLRRLLRPALIEDRVVRRRKGPTVLGA